MTFDRASLLLNMLLILVSVGAHQAGAEEFAFFLVTLALCVIVWRREKAGRPLLLSDTLGTIICGVAFVALMWRGISSATTGAYRVTDVGIGPVGDFLIVFQWVTLCRKRQGHDYFWMYLVTLIHMGTAGLQMPGLTYGFFFIAYAFLAISALAMSHAAKEARAAGVDFAPWEATAPGTEPVAASARIGGRFYLGALVATPAILIAVALLFIVMPRTSATGTIAPAILHLGQQPTSGFSNTVRLGAVGQIQEDPTPVMHVGIRDPKTGESLQVASLLLRGLPLDIYVQEKGAWSWQVASRRRGQWYWDHANQSPHYDSSYETSFPGYSEAPCREITCDITIEPLDTPLLFAPFAPESVSAAKRFQVGFNARTYVLESSLPYRRTPLSYTVTSRLFDRAPPPKPPEHTLAEEFLRPYLALPSELSPKIRDLAQEIAPESLRTDYEKAERILDYLSDSGRFSYTNDLQPTAGVEPVEDFLFNLKRGHCEYFASSMVVLLREVNVPARLVNGFKASEWNPLSETYIVRQQHAHSWVEAYLRPYGWRTLDPTAVSRDAATPAPMFARRIGSNIYDWMDSLWVAYVLNFDSFSQAGSYGWLRKIAGLSEQLTSGPLKHFAIGVGASRLQPSDLSGPLVVILIAIRWTVALLLGVGLVWVMAHGVVAWRKRERRPPRPFKFYARMERLLRRRGLRRAGAETPREFSAALAERQWPAAGEVAAITERFCGARYGARPLTEADLREIEQALQAISRAR